MLATDPEILRESVAYNEADFKILWEYFAEAENDLEPS